MSFPRYEKYKDSGVEWLGEVPEGWDILALKRLACLTTGMTPPTDDQDNYADDNGFEWLRPEDIDESGNHSTASKFLSIKGWAISRKVAPKSTLICCIGTIGKVGFVIDEVSTNQQITAAQFFRYQRYYYYALVASKPVLEISSTGNVLRILNTERLGAISFPCPPNTEAGTIAAFLDHETGKIDALVAEQEKLIGLLKEKRQAVISHAVTKGLDPNARMKDSGVEWLGEVPEGWEVLPIRSLARGGKDSFIDGDWIESPYITDEGIRLIQTGNIGVGQYKEQGFRFITENTFQALKCTEVDPGNILICRLAEPVGRGCLAPDLGMKMITSVDVCILKPSDQVDPRFVVYISTSAQYLGYMEGQCRGGTRDRVSRSFLGAVRLPLPPLPEQRTIAAFLDHETGKIDTLIEEAQRAIELMKERRTALISAAVTGKIDVRGYCPA